MPGMYQGIKEVFYQTDRLGVGNGHYEFSIDGVPGSENPYREIIACYPIKYTVIILKPDKINLEV